MKKPKAITDETRANDYKALFGTPLGQRVLTDILIKGNVFSGHKELYQNGQNLGTRLVADPIVLAQMEGARQLALYIASFINFDATEFSYQHQQTQGDEY